MNDLMSEPILFVSAILFSVIAYIGKNLISKLEELRKEINSMDKNLGIIIERLKNSEVEISRLKEKVELNSNRIMKIEARNGKV